MNVWKFPGYAGGGRARECVSGETPCLPPMCLAGLSRVPLNPLWSIGRRLTGRRGFGVHLDHSRRWPESWTLRRRIFIGHIGPMVRPQRYRWADKGYLFTPRIRAGLSLAFRCASRATRCDDPCFRRTRLVSAHCLPFLFVAMPLVRTLSLFPSLRIRPCRKETRWQQNSITPSAEMQLPAKTTPAKEQRG